MKIEGGYYLKAKCIQNADISHAPPHVREIWDWLLLKAMFKDGEFLKKGQVLTTYDEIRQGLAWYIGWRKMTYSKWDCEKAMKLLTKMGMITTQKTTKGMVITICKYCYYQDVKNYESHTASHRKATGKPQSTDTIEKEVKEGMNKEEIKDTTFLLPPDIDEEVWKQFEEMRNKIKAPLTKRAKELTVIELQKIQDKTGTEKNEILQQSIMKSWRGVFELTENTKQKGEWFV